MQRKNHAPMDIVDIERAKAGGFELLTLGITTEVPLSMVRRKPEGGDRETVFFRILIKGTYELADPRSLHYNICRKHGRFVDFPVQMVTASIRHEERYSCTDRCTPACAAVCCSHSGQVRQQGCRRAPLLTRLRAA